MKKTNLPRLLLVLLCCLLAFPGNAGIAEDSRADASAARLPDSVLMTYYDHSMFAGDSLICMFRNYVRARQKTDPQYFAGIDFRCAYSFTLQMAAWEKVMESSSANLKYKAREMTLSQIAQTLQPEKSLFWPVSMIILPGSPKGKPESSAVSGMWKQRSACSEKPFPKPGCFSFP